jgi:hypothetical protein
MMEHIRRDRPLTAERLRHVIHYDPVSGLFTWVMSRGTAMAGNRAGSVHKPTGYRLIRIDGIKYRCARLAWLYMTGDWPPVEVDHRDLNFDNDRWLNLRAATQSQNSANRRRLRNNTTGHTGVRRRRTGWQARISVERRLITLGTFMTITEASAAYRAAKVEYFGEFGRIEP